MDGKIDAYRRADAMGKSQIDLILMVYDGAIKALQTAAEHYRGDEFGTGYEEMQKARRFVTHLYTTLDAEQGGEVAGNLGKMYAYVLAQSYLIEATKDLEQLEGITKIMQNLRAGWTDLKAQHAPPTERPDDQEDAPASENIEEFVTTA